MDETSLFENLRLPSVPLPVSSATNTYCSPVPRAVLAAPNEPVILGVDEAGRGPVLGPMVYGIAYCLKDYSQKLKTQYGFADSKTLTVERRDQLMHSIIEPNGDLCQNVGWMTTTMTARDISSEMLKPRSVGNINLNEQAHDATIKLIQRVIDQGVNLKEVYVDTVGVPEAYQRKLSNRFPGIRVTVTKKADSLFPIVSTASIVAKVTRDCSLYHMAKGANWGSGYPSDPRTVKWLNSNVDPIFGWDSTVRFSWQTARDSLVRNGAVPMVWEDELPPNDTFGNVANLMSKSGTTGKSNEGKSETELESNVSTKKTDFLGNDTHVPGLIHTNHDTSHTAAESESSGVTWVQQLLLGVQVDVVTAETLEVEEVLGERDGVVDCEVVSDQVHEVFHDRLKVVESWDTDGQTQTVTNNGPEHSWDLGQRRPERLGTQGDGVHVWNVGADGGQGEQHTQELTESVERVLSKNGVDQSSDRVLGVELGVLGVGLDTGDGSSTQDLGEDQWEAQTKENGKEQFGWAGGWLHVGSVVSGIGGPACCESEDSTSERKNTTSKSLTGTPLSDSRAVFVRNTRHENAVDGQSSDDGDENNHVWNPGPFLVSVDEMVAKEGDTDGNQNQNQTAGPWRTSVVVDDVDKLGRGHDVHGTPTNTGNTVNGSKDTHSKVSNKEPGQNHLSKTKLSTVDGVEGNRRASQHVEEDDHQNRGTKVEVENTVRKSTQRKGGNHKVGRQPHGSTGPQRVVGLFLNRNSFDASSFTVEHADQVGIEARVGLFELGSFLHKWLFGKRIVRLLF
ncbi:hypothetical protein OGAPHI_000810 [Ogataea philodendri]|uniref:Ribonuclease n=1 Tax=Ogataea philodendri TaxID=1378263 RepID=A0A9P8PH08_9ASCO|nr:uncharacterized protein OGAPHI_000810 [Ogataea philodendri]KAH3671099.1 hypothetical protein OGAPHI_000810 [Ogataea philodendri]